MFDQPFYHVIFCRPLRTTYCPVPKAACTSWKQYLRQAMGYPPLDDEAIHARHKNGFLYANMIEREELSRILFSKEAGYFKFTVCRNPYSRLKSAYRDLVFATEDKPARGGAATEALRMTFCQAFDKKPSSVPHLSFDQFLRAIDASGPSSLDRHWQLQSVLTCSNLIKYDVDLKLEEMADRSYAVTERIEGGATMILRSNKGPTEDGDPLNFSPKMREIVRRVYARDFARFKYDLDDIPVVSSPATDVTAA